MENIELNTTTKIPILGFGTWQLDGDKVSKPLEKAIGIGYRHIDTAYIYRNQEEIGKVIRDSGLKREELFITSKLWHDFMEKDQVIKSAEETLNEMRLEYVDLYLIHWPNKEVTIYDTLEEMGKLKENGRVRAIGVSNFTIQHLEKALKVGVEITNNQVELHPSFNQHELREYCKEKGIVVTAYSPIGQGKDLNEKVVLDLADKYQTSTSGVVLAWLRQNGIVAVPRSSKEEHIRANWESLKVELTKEDLELIETITQGERLVNPPFAEFED